MLIWFLYIGGSVLGLIAITVLLFIWIKIGTFAFYSGKRNFERHYKKGKRDGKSQRPRASEDNV